MTSKASWVESSLGDLIELQRGHDLPSQRRVSGDIPILTSSGVGGFHNVARYEGPGVAIGRSGVIGGATYVEGPYWPLNTCLFVRDFRGNDPRWVYYLLKSIDFSGFNSGSAQPSLNRNYLAQIPIALPPFAEQRAIAAILSSLDDKISCNTKLVQTIDDLFLRKAKYALSSDGSPDRKLSDLIGETLNGDWGVSGPTELYSEAVNCIRGADISDLQGSGLGSMPQRYIKPASLAKRRIIPNDLVVEISGGSPTQSTGRSVLATPALLARLSKPAISSNFCRVLRLRDTNHSYLVHGLLRVAWKQGEFFQYENGTTGIKNLAFKDFCDEKTIMLPDDDALKTFNGAAASLFSQQQSLGSESHTLSAIRDALLPQLISGELQVKDAEKVLEDAAV